MKKLKKSIIVIFILVFILLIILLVIKFNKKNIENELNQNLDVGNGKEEVVANTEIRKVSDKISYYLVKDIIDQYFEYINMIDINHTAELEEDSNLALSSLMSMFNDKYIKEFNITTEKLQEDLQKYINCEYTIEDMYMMEKTVGINIFLASVKIQEKDDLINFIVVADFENLAFELYCDDYVRKYGYNENMSELTNLEVNSIDQNLFNKIKNISVTNEDLAMNYFNNFKYKMVNNIEESYNMLDEEYRKRRFENINIYKQYIEENIFILRKITPVEYLINKYEDYTEYVCKDQYGNIYTFDETAIMDYTVKLDTYTIATDEFIQEYAEGDDHKKAIMNIEKFIQMINNYDFNAAYDVLNNTFRENNFGSEEAFKKYMIDTYYRYNDIVINDFSDENGTYVYKTTISDKEDISNEKDMNIIMKLNEEMNFEMSFEIIE